MSKSNIIVTGEKFAGSGFRTIEAVVRELMSESSNEVLIATYLLTSEWMV